MNAETLRGHLTTAARLHQIPLRPGQLGRLANHVASAANNEAVAPMVGPLTPMQFEALLSIAAGETEPETARRLYLSPNTVKAHRRSLYRQLRANNAAHAVDIGYRAGLLDVARGGVIE